MQPKEYEKDHYFVIDNACGHSFNCLAYPDNFTFYLSFFKFLLTWKSKNVWLIRYVYLAWLYAKHKGDVINFNKTWIWKNYVQHRKAKHIYIRYVDDAPNSRGSPQKNKQIRSYFEFGASFLTILTNSINWNIK